VRLFDFAPRAVAAIVIASGAPCLCLPLAARAGDPPAAEAPAAERPADPAAPADPALPVRRTGEVAITATRGERELLDTAGNVTVIDRATIERSGARDVPELLRREAGLFVTNDIGSPEGYRVEGRGFQNGGGNGSSLLVLMDGRRLNEPDAAAMDWSFVRLERVERIEIVRGPASALYGDVANAGVVQILTRRGEGAGELVARGRRASYDTTTGSLFGGGSHGPLAATLAVDGWDGDGYRERSGYQAASGAGTLRYTPTDRLLFELAGGLSDDERLRPGTLTKDEMRALGRDAAAPGQEDNRDDVQEGWLQGLATATPHEHLTLRVLPYWRERDDQARVATPTPGGLADFTTDSTSRSWGGSAQLEWDAPLAGLESRLLVGGEWLDESVDRQQRFDSPDGFSDADADLERRIWSLFLQEELALTDTLLLSAGLRFDDVDYDGEVASVSDFGFPFVDELRLDRDGSEWSPRAALTWRFVPTTSAYASYARGFRFPNLDEAVGFTGALFDLRPQDSDSYEVGVKHRSGKLSANLALYWMEVEDEILLNHEIDQFGFASPQNANFDRTRHRGVETWFSLRPFGWLELYGSYTFDDATIERDRTATIAVLDGNRIPITPRHRGNVGTLVTIPRSWFRVELGANLNVVGKRYVANDLQNEFAKLDDYATLDLHASFRPRIGEHVELALTGRVLNALDQRYSEFAGERTFVRGEIGYNPAPDRSYELVVALTVRR
jgi:outer membrane receptor protein involved in Fe transport